MTIIPPIITRSQNSSTPEGFLGAGQLYPAVTFPLTINSDTDSPVRSETVSGAGFSKFVLAVDWRGSLVGANSLAVTAYVVPPDAPFDGGRALLWAFAEALPSGGDRITTFTSGQITTPDVFPLYNLAFELFPFNDASVVVINNVKLWLTT